MTTDCPDCTTRQCPRCDRAAALARARTTLVAASQWEPSPDELVRHLVLRPGVSLRIVIAQADRDRARIRNDATLALGHIDGGGMAGAWVCINKILTSGSDYWSTPKGCTGLGRDLSAALDILLRLQETR